VNDKRIDLEVNAYFYPPGDSYETAKTNLVKQLVREGDVCVDLGANIGWYTVLLSELVGPRGHVYAFEPHPSNFEVLKRNTTGRENVTLYQIAVSDSFGEKTLYENSENPGGHSLVLTTRALHDTGLKVKVTTMDIVFGSRHIDFVKCDVEGAGVRVLRGMRGVIRSNPKLKMLAEAWAGEDWVGDGMKRYKDELQMVGFKLTVITKAPNGTQENLLCEL